jgi:electron transport complex protein RnfG
MRRFIDESWLVLVLGTGFALLLGAAQAGFGPRIASNRRAALEAAVFEVVPQAVRFERVPVGAQEVFRCLDQAGAFVGWAIPASGFGFQDKIDLVFGLSADGATVTGLTVLNQKETPGLGNKIEEQAWRAQFKGLDATRPASVVKGAPRDQAHQVQAVTGATISSVSAMNIVNRALADLRPQLLEHQ